MYGALNEVPKIGVWSDVLLELPSACPDAASGSFSLAVVLSGQFERKEPLERMAARIGALSSLRGMQYWSVTGARWRTLVNDSFAIEAPSTLQPRADYSVEEVLSEEVLYFAQDDSRSTGYNAYAMRVSQPGSETLVVETRNVTPVRLLMLTLFESDTLRAFHFLRRSGAGEWYYYGLFLVVSGVDSDHARSLMNRAAAYYRFLAGQPATASPPLAR